MADIVIRVPKFPEIKGFEEFQETIENIKESIAEMAAAIPRITFVYEDDDEEGEEE